MTTTRTARLLPGLLLLTTLLAAGGCNWTDWFDASGSTARSSPIISDLVIAPTSVFCGVDNPFAYSFAYSDPQNDLFQVHLILKHATDTTWVIDRFVPWSDMDVATSAGRAIGTFFFDCGGPPRGVWTLTVELEDERGHQSNILEGQVTLVSD